MNVKQLIESKLKAIEPCATLSVSDKADFQCNVCFTLAKQQNKKPTDIAEYIASIWNSKHKKLAHASVIGGFINFAVSNAILQEVAEFISDKKKLPLTLEKQKTVFFDYGGANIAKELHIGHLRSPIIGEAIKRVFQAFGHKTIAGAYLGDWGLQMGLVIASILDQSINIDDVTLEMLSELYPAASKRKDNDTEFYHRASDITTRFQNFEEPYYGMWQKLRNLSVTQIEKNYKILNCTFDIMDGESSYQTNVDIMMSQLAKLNLVKESNGALIVEVNTEQDNKPMPPLLIRKQNGGLLYATSDVAALFTRMKQYNPDQFIYVTDARQSLHFEQVFRTVRLAKFVTPETVLTHIGYGTINGKDGKPFKTREGGTIKLEDIINTVSQATTELKVGISAIKFADLINSVNKDYIFDLNKCISFEGKTGPYILYTVVRINSILNKATNFMPKFSHYDKYQSPQIRDIIIKILKLTESYTVALNTLSLNSIADAIYNLANSFSVFYAEQNILAEPDESKRQFLLSIAYLTKIALEYGLNTLAIDTVEKM